MVLFRSLTLHQLLHVRNVQLFPFVLAVVVTAGWGQRLQTFRLGHAVLDVVHGPTLHLAA